MKNDYSLIVFDWDGTLMDSVARIVACMQAAMDDLGDTPKSPGEIRDIIGLGLREAMQTLFPEGDAAHHRRLAERYRYHYLEASPVESRLFDGVHEMLDELKSRKHKLAVATGKGRSGLDKVLQETGCVHYFNTSRCSDETSSKPDPRMLHEIMQELGVPAAETLMIGDTEYDMAMANNAGVSALAVSYGVHDTHRLCGCDPLDCVHSVRELRDWLLSAPL
jgi:phosphoglycolate phosphatase